jgi:hypothetical protein
VENGYVSITPLRLDLTDEAELSRAIQESHAVHISAEEVVPTNA